MMLLREFIRTRDIFRLLSVFLFAWYFIFAATHQNTWHIIDSMNLVIHEAGHAIFFFLGEFLDIAAGSGFQILVPFVFIIYFGLRREFFSSALLLFWLGESIINVSVYAGDAIVMQLPLLGGDGIIHDWNYLLSHSGLLSLTPAISLTIFILGIAVMIAGLFFGCMFATKPATKRARI